MRRTRRPARWSARWATWLPEQTLGESGSVSPQSDVYSLGAILFELLTGRPPFQNASPFDTLMQVMEEDPPRPRKLNRDVPLTLEWICLKCLEKQPRNRYRLGGRTRGRPGEVSARRAAVDGRAGADPFAGSLESPRARAGFASRGAGRLRADLAAQVHGLRDRTGRIT